MIHAQKRYRGNTDGLEPRDSQSENTVGRQ